MQTSNHLLGPKPFPLDRLLAIFYSVVDSRVAPTASIFSQVAQIQLFNCFVLLFIYFASALLQYSFARCDFRTDGLILLN